MENEWVEKDTLPREPEGHLAEDMGTGRGQKLGQSVSLFSSPQLLPVLMLETVPGGAV